ncbi:hypothetical protein [Rhodococcus qingshengii]|uniref:hypothetical protein n=1 Tax=Rhodococcus qingshengii TaxID=334542 RepID=UPI002942DD07|nr:hypothetical protein [Rhodococcus qingshengii]WOI85997.1 hypothetical protein R0122_22725 [Rhodococcus qingshengii]
MSTEKRITSIKKSSLAGLSHEWDDECYAYITPATYEDTLKVTEGNIASLSEREQVEYQLNTIKEHFVSGKIKAFNGEDFALTDMTVDDAVASVGIADKLYSDIMGFDLDPKDIRRAAMRNALQTPSESNTETSSSEDSQPRSLDE